MQHIIAVKIAKMLGETNETLQDRLLLIYGIETFSNEFLKGAVCIIIAMFFKCWKVVILNIIYLKLLRGYAGGRHFKRNIICVCVSIITIVPMAILGNLFILPRRIQILVLGIEALIFLMCAPYHKGAMYIRAKWVNKVLTLLIFIIGIGLGWKLGKNYYFNNLILVGGVTSLMLIKIPWNNLSCESSNDEEKVDF